MGSLFMVGAYVNTPHGPGTVVKHIENNNMFWLYCVSIEGSFEDLRLVEPELVKPYYIVNHASKYPQSIVRDIEQDIYDYLID